TIVGPRWQLAWQEHSFGDVSGVERRGAGPARSQCQAGPAAAQPPAFSTRSAEAGYFASRCAGRTGRVEKLPPQFGQAPARTPVAHSGQNVHSNVQMKASASGGRSLSQHSQFGRS